MPRERHVLDSSSHCPCFIFVCFEHSPCAIPISNTTSLLKKKDKTHLETGCGAFGPDGFLLKVGERFTVRKVWAKQLPEEAAKAPQLGTNSSWKNESPYNEDHVLLREVGDLRFDGSSMRQAFQARTAGDWADFFTKKTSALCMGKRERARMPQRDGARIRGSKEQCTADQSCRQR